MTISESVLIREVFCGHDGTMFLSDEGVIYACGSNAENKLALNHRNGFIAAMRNMFTRVRVFVLFIDFLSTFKLPASAKNLLMTDPLNIIFVTFGI